MKRPVTILGAGLVGSLLGVILSKRGHAVTIYERRPDMRKAAVGAGRSINLAMSTRGWKALEIADLRKDIEAIAIPMYGRTLHQADGQVLFQQYGKNREAIYSVSRGELNRKLMSLAEEQGVQIYFDQKCTGVQISENILEIESEGNSQKIQADLLFGADGAFSALRNSYIHTDKVNASQHYIEHGYKELCIPPAPGGGWLLEKESLHIWPRHNFMLIALPNMDGSFTCTLFLPFEGRQGFDHLRSDEAILDFFKTHFPDVIGLMPSLLEDFKENPTASLITTHIYPWHFEDKSALIGDAAHAIVPFYGQGMNAGFEDVSILTELIEEHGNDWKTILDLYDKKRKPNGDAVAELALLNFVEMRDRVADPVFLERKKIEKELGRLYPELFNSVYEMVSFSHAPYTNALHCIAAQDRLLEQIMAQGNFAANMEDPVFRQNLEQWLKTYHAGLQLENDK